MPVRGGNLDDGQHDPQMKKERCKGKDVIDAAAQAVHLFCKYDDEGDFTISAG
jgi:hypothetical protein